MEINTSTQFNEKFKENIEAGHYGLAINDPKVVSFLDDYFSKSLHEGIEFKIQQIKIKFGYACVYSTLPRDFNVLLEKQINILTGKVKFNPIIVG